MAWRTYTPDGRTLEVEFTDGTWIATCEGARGVGATAASAIRSALGDDAISIGDSGAAREGWIAEQAAMLERELEQL